MATFIALSFFLTALTASILIGLYNRDNLSPSPRTQGILVASSYVISQIMTSWFLEKIMYLFPSKSSTTYSIIIISIFLLISLLFAKEMKSLVQLSFKAIKNNVLFSVSCFFTTLIIIFIAINLPVDSNDPLEYIQVAKNISQNGSFSHYPLVNSDLLKGYYPWSHPSGYVGMLVWSFNFSEGLNDFLLLKVYNPLIAISLLVLFFNIYSNTNKYLRITLSYLSVLATPLLTIEVFHFHIDPLRIYTFFLCAILAFELYKSNSYSQYILLGLLIGITLHSHSLGILIIPMLLGIISIEYYQSKDFALKPLFISSIIILIFVGFRYYINLNILGYIVGDNTPLWKVESLNYNYFLELSRGLGTPSNKLLNGILKVFTHVYSFGVIFSVYSILFLKNLRQNQEKFKYNFNNYETISNFIILFWFLGSTFITLLGSDILIKNDRYTLTIFPFVLLSTCMMLKREISEESNI